MGDDFGLPPLEEILDRVDGESGRKNGEIESPWYSETCPTLENQDVPSEIKVIRNKHNNNNVACFYFLRNKCKAISFGGGIFGPDIYKECDFL